jgi:hypothetical protein
VVAKIKGEIMDSKNKRRSIHEMIYGNTPIRLRGVGWREIEAGWWGDEEARNALALYMDFMDFMGSVGVVVST